MIKVLVESVYTSRYADRHLGLNREWGFSRILNCLLFRAIQVSHGQSKLGNIMSQYKCLRVLALLIVL